MNFLSSDEFNNLTHTQRVEWFRRTDEAWRAFIEGDGSEAGYKKLQIYYREILDEVRREI